MLLGVDALNLSGDRRGMGRFVRTVLRSFEKMNDVEPVLVVRTRDDGRLLAEEFPHAVVTLRERPRRNLDAQWYPWNGMRFKSEASSAVTIHDTFAFEYPARSVIARRREQTPILRAIRDADSLSAVSHWTANAISTRFGVPAARVAVLPPIADPWWHPVEVEERRPYVLYVGGAEPRKNADLMIAAFEEALHGGEIELVVVGALRAAAQARLAALRAKHRRAAPDDEQLRALYSGALAVAVPSMEGVGLPALEAMACGAPVIALDAGALPETCEGAALLASGDVENWSAALRRIVQDRDLREELRERGLARIRRIDCDGTAKALLASLRR